MTNEEIAIQQHLSKPRPYSNACGCMGAQPINQEDKNFRWTDTVYSIRVTDLGENKMEILHVLRKTLVLDLSTVLEIKNSGRFEGSVFGQSKRDQLAIVIEKLGGTVEVFDNKPSMEPACPCAMAWYEIVDNTYYRIKEIRDISGIRLEAEEIGPVGGPYKK